MLSHVVCTIMWGLTVPGEAGSPVRPHDWSAPMKSHPDFDAKNSVSRHISHFDRRGFSLVELLTVIFIISLLIAILVPSLSSSRNAAKKLTTAKSLDAIKVGLEMFKNDNAAAYSQTGGFPPSFSHPPITGYTFEADQGQFPFRKDNPIAYGAQWLPALLMGIDQLGFIKRSAVPEAIKSDPTKWYTADALGSGKGITDRSPLYLDPGSLPMKKVKDLPGRPNYDLWPGWTQATNNPLGTENLPVIVDAFDQPILYYAANKFGQTTNMLEEMHKKDNDYSTGGPQAKGPPFYFHQDNWGFTGKSDGTTPVVGWDFGNSGANHAIARSGHELTHVDLVQEKNKETFARYIIDRKIYSTLGTQRVSDAPLRPVNSDSYLLISPGVDGRYGTTDDVSNLPPWPDEH